MRVVFEEEVLGEYLVAAHYSESAFGLGEAFIAATESALAKIRSNWSDPV